MNEIQHYQKSFLLHYAVDSISVKLYIVSVLH